MGRLTNSEKTEGRCTVMTGIICPVCGGDLNEIIHGDGVQCETCGYIIRSDGSSDVSEMEDEYEK